MSIFVGCKMLTKLTVWTECVLNTGDFIDVRNSGEYGAIVLQMYFTCIIIARILQMDTYCLHLQPLWIRYVRIKETFNVVHFTLTRTLPQDLGKDLEANIFIFIS